MSYSHWFWTYKTFNGFHVATGRIGGGCGGVYWYETVEDLENAKKRFMDDGYKFLGHRDVSFV
jgi:hypothetical protein